MVKSNFTKQKLLAEIAYLYYKSDLTQQEIAQKFGMSRFKVLRLLKESKQQGIVKIEINGPLEECVELGIELKAFGAQEVIVVPYIEGTTPEEAMQNVGEAAAQFLQKEIQAREETAVGIAWGKTVCEVVKALATMHPHPQPKVSVVQLFGGITEQAYNISATSLATKLAEIYGGRCFLLHAPVIVDSPDLCRRMSAEPSVKQTLDLAKQVDIALVGIGLVGEKSSLYKAGLLSQQDLSILEAAGAVGVISAHFFDINGIECASSLRDRNVGLAISELKSIPIRIAAACGLEKAPAILGALRGGLVNVLITDVQTARKVLELARG